MGEAAIAHHYGLPENLALASVISTPAKTLGLDHRIGYVKEGMSFPPTRHAQSLTAAAGFDAGTRAW